MVIIVAKFPHNHCQDFGRTKTNTNTHFTFHIRFPKNQEAISNFTYWVKDLDEEAQPCSSLESLPIKHSAQLICKRNDHHHHLPNTAEINKWQLPKRQKPKSITPQKDIEKRIISQCQPPSSQTHKF